VKVRTDDAIHESRGELWELKGWVLPFPVAYVFLFIFLAGMGMTVGFIKILGGSWVSAGMYGLAGGFFAAGIVRRELEKDLTFRALVMTFTAWLRWWWRYRVDAVRESSARKPGLLKLKPIKRKKRRA
jgi:hypothetical protein